MKLGKLNSLHLALIALVVVAAIMVGVSYSRQKKAESRATALASAIMSATSIEQLRNSVGGYVAYTGAGKSADAAAYTHSEIRDGGWVDCYVAQYGDDAGQTWCGGGDTRAFHDFWSWFW